MTALELPQPFSALPSQFGSGVVVSGETPEETLGRLVLAFSQVCTAGLPVTPDGSLSIEVAGGTDLATIAIDALGAAHMLYAKHRRLPWSVSVQGLSREQGARLLLRLGPYDPARHAQGLVVKAVAYRHARFELDGGLWRAHAVFELSM